MRRPSNAAHAHDRLTEINTLQAAWAETGRPLHGTGVEPMFRSAFFAGAAATLAIVKGATPLSQAAFDGIMTGLEEEVKAYTAARLAEPGHHTAEQRETARREIPGYRTFAIPLVGRPDEAARRVEMAIPPAKAAGMTVGCNALVPYLLEAIQHALILGFSEAGIAADVEKRAAWWHERLHAGDTPEQAAKAARNLLAHAGIDVFAP